MALSFAQRKAAVAAVLRQALARIDSNVDKPETWARTVEVLERALVLARGCEKEVQTKAMLEAEGLTAAAAAAEKASPEAVAMKAAGLVPDLELCPLCGSDAWAPQAGCPDCGEGPTERLVVR
jgi:hypothetical protein